MKKTRLLPLALMLILILVFLPTTSFALMEKEPNDSPSQAQRLERGDMVSGYITGVDEADEDYYKVRLNCGADGVASFGFDFDPADLAKEDLPIFTLYIGYLTDKGEFITIYDIPIYDTWFGEEIFQFATFTNKGLNPNIDHYLMVTGGEYYNYDEKEYWIRWYPNAKYTLWADSWPGSSGDGGKEFKGWLDEYGMYYENGVFRTGWLKDGKSWYYLDSYGWIEKGWTKVSGKWYYLNSKGKMLTGWKKDNNKWYYLDSSGVMRTAWVRVGSSWYYMNPSGVMQTGWVKVGSSWYYMDNSGVMQTGWQKFGRTWYYMSSGGAMQTGWTRVGSTWYYMGTDGAMQTGWLKLGKTWYYLGSSGAMQTGWTKISGKWYYFYSDGSMAYSTQIDGYWLDSSGVMK